LKDARAQVFRRGKIYTVPMITTVAIAAVLAGYLLGMRFTVFVLFPAIPLAVTIVVAVGFALDSSAAAILLAAILAVIGLQIGYVAATAIAFLRPRGASSHGLKKLRWYRGH
jgi:hypothetical protein